MLFEETLPVRNAFIVRFTVGNPLMTGVIVGIGILLPEQSFSLNMFF